MPIDQSFSDPLIEKIFVRGPSIQGYFRHFSGIVAELEDGGSVSTPISSRRVSLTSEAENFPFVGIPHGLLTPSSLFSSLAFFFSFLIIVSSCLISSVPNPRNFFSSPLCNRVFHFRYFASAVDSISPSSVIHVIVSIRIVTDFFRTDVVRSLLHLL